MLLDKNQGFSLVEIMITVTILAIIAGFSTNSYLHHVRMTRRVAAISALVSAQLAEETYRIDHNRYGALTEIKPASNPIDRYYTLTISDISDTSYTITATALGTQRSDVEGETSCNLLMIKISNGNQVKIPEKCWPK